jgi:hypothetical protein
MNGFKCVNALHDIAQQEHARYTSSPMEHPRYSTSTRSKFTANLLGYGRAQNRGRAAAALR